MEFIIRERGFKKIAGVDEVGKGALFGPVVSCAIIIEEKINGVKDSKLLSQKKREELFEIILDKSLDVGIGIASNVEIEELNIRNATFLAMKRAVLALDLAPDIILVDGEYLEGVDIPRMGIIKGDRLVYSIACASIVAKVARDFIMGNLHNYFPKYNLKINKGYATNLHREMIKYYGCSPLHRAKFRGSE
ncbi:MAG: ribonuclease HII [Candidatus Aminicenantia bacterium]